MDRTPEQVIASARAMDRAVAAGLPGDLLAIMLSARAAWWAEGTGEEVAWPHPLDLQRILAHPASREVDEVLWRAIRRRVTPRP